MEDTNAWMIGLRGGHKAAVGELELMHVLPDSPQLFPVPKAPLHCRQVFLWEGHMLPVLDLSLWFGEARDDGGDAHMGIFRYRPAPGEALRYGCLIIEGPPRQVLVNDGHACELPGDGGAWRQVAHACFDYAGTPIPVLNLARIFGSPLH